MVQSPLYIPNYAAIIHCSPPTPFNPLPMCNDRYRHASILSAPALHGPGQACPGWQPPGRYNGSSGGGDGDDDDDGGGGGWDGGGGGDGSGYGGGDGGDGGSGEAPATEVAAAVTEPQNPL